MPRSLHAGSRPHENRQAITLGSCCENRRWDWPKSTPTAWRTGRQARSSGSQVGGRDGCMEAGRQSYLHCCNTHKLPENAAYSRGGQEASFAQTKGAQASTHCTWELSQLFALQEAVLHFFRLNASACTQPQAVDLPQINKGRKDSPPYHGVQQLRQQESLGFAGMAVPALGCCQAGACAINHAILKPYFSLFSIAIKLRINLYPQMEAGSFMHTGNTSDHGLQHLLLPDSALSMLHSQHLTF